MSNATPFVCPECGNTNLEDMNLYLVDHATQRYSFMETSEGLPVFQWDKEVGSETDGSIAPVMECNVYTNGARCYGWWNVDWRKFDIG